MDFSELEYQNGFEATLDDRVTDTDTYIRMTPVPEGSKGHLVLEDTSKENFEVIRFDSKDAGGVYIGPEGARNLDGSSSGVHPRGARVRMNITAQDIEAWQGDADQLRTDFNTVVANANNWLPIPAATVNVVNNGQRSYDLTVVGQDLRSIWHPGTRLRTTRTVAAPTQSASLNGTNQYFNDTTVAGMNFTDDFSVGAWVKLTSYGSPSPIMGRFNGTNGWIFFVEADGLVTLSGSNGSASNFRRVKSRQAIPLNEWVHITAQLDMSANSVSATTSYMMFNGVDVPADPVANGTSPSALVQAGNMEVGSYNSGAQFFPGKIAQAWVSSSKTTQADARTLMSQNITPAQITANNIISAYSLSNSLTDLNTTNANNLTPQGGATTTNADAAWGQQSDGTISSTLDYAIVQTPVSFTGGNSTVTVQVPEGSTIPTSGGVSAVSYSNVEAPYGFSLKPAKWELKTIKVTGTLINGFTTVFALATPAGVWDADYSVGMDVTRSSGSGGRVTTSISDVQGTTAVFPESTSLVSSNQGSAPYNAQGIAKGGIPLANTTMKNYYVVCQALITGGGLTGTTDIFGLHYFKVRNALL